MTLSTLTEQFLNYLLEKKPKKFVSIEEDQLPEDFKSQIFLLGDELEKVELIKNLQKSGQPGNRKIDFFITPKGLSYFKDKEKQETAPKKQNKFQINIIGLRAFVKKIFVAGNSITLPNTKEKSWFERILLPIILAVIPAVIYGVFLLYQGKYANEPNSNPTPEILSTSILSPEPSSNLSIVTETSTMTHEETNVYGNTSSQSC